MLHSEVLSVYGFYFGTKNQAMLPLALNNLMKHLQTPLTSALTSKHEKSQKSLSWTQPNPLKSMNCDQFYKRFLCGILSLMEARPMEAGEVLMEAYEYPSEIVFPMGQVISVGYMYVTANVGNEPSSKAAPEGEEYSDNNLSNISNSNNNSNLSQNVQGEAPIK
mmetsp:Transcript_1932/g.2772  ORF Transcript_1932/g.2772 Transcript_1932/m.2772 type:complete len:164 (-) Transcript_1932:3894-4385(-)